MARIDYVELPSATAHELTRGFYAKAFGWTFANYGPDYAATTNGDVGALAGDPSRRSGAGVRCGRESRRHYRQADFRFPRRPQVPLHRSVGQRARRLADGRGLKAIGAGLGHRPVKTFNVRARPHLVGFERWLDYYPCVTKVARITEGKPKSSSIMKGLPCVCFADSSVIAARRAAPGRAPVIGGVTAAGAVFA